MIKNKNVNMLQGKLLPSILRYVIPIVLVSLMSTTFHAVDIMVLGQLANTNAVASVGATSSIISLLVTIFAAIGGGVRVILAQQIGAGNSKNVSQTVSTAIITAFFLGLFTSVLAFTFGPMFLRITSCPAECFDGALLYMQLYVSAAPAIMLYSFASAIINTSGDSKSPLYYMIISGLTNVILNIMLCLILEQKVAAVAIATAVSQLVGAFLCLSKLIRIDGICKLNIKKLQWNSRTFKSILKVGFPLALTSAMIPIANLQIQPQLNFFGATAIAACSAVGSIEGMVAAFSHNAFSPTASAFIGQNLGAGQKKRVRDSFLYCLFLSIGISIVISSLVMIFSDAILSLYLSDISAIGIAKYRMQYTLGIFAVCTTNSILASLITAFGYTLYSSLNALISQLIFRVFWMTVIYPLKPTLHMLFICYSISWFITLAINITLVVYLYFGKFKKGTLKRII